MGATSWRYYTPYCPDPEAALQVLRTDVFARGEYADPTGPLEATLRQTARRLGQDPDSPEVRAEIENAVRVQRAVRTGDMSGLSRADRALVRRLQAVGQLADRLGSPRPAIGGSRPGSIAELLERAAECGTHSVLDIEHVATRPGFGIAAPMSVTTRLRVFGTAEPTHNDVERHWQDLAEKLDRWQARYVVVFRDGTPHEYAFIGCSGD